jgi:predicted Zn-dependent peptidase
MKNYIFLALLAFSLFQCSPKTGEKVSDTSSQIPTQLTEDFRKNAPEAGPAPQLKMGEYTQVELDNGLKIIVVENHKLPRVSFQLFVDTDPILEREESGFVSMTGDLLSTGTKNRTKAEIDESIDFIGASLSTSRRGAFGSCLSQHKRTLLDIMSDVVLNPAFDEEEFEKLRKQMLSGIASSKNNPNAIASNIRSQINFGKSHPYGEFATETTVENISLESCKEYYSTFFKPNVSYFVVVGDIKADEAKTLAEEFFGDWETGDVPKPNNPTPEAPDATNVVFVDRPGAVQSVINVTYPVDLKLTSDDYVAARVMNNILGGGVFSGYLMQNLREDKAFTYGARSSLSPDRLVGSFQAYASVRNEVTDSAIVEFLHEMNRIRSEEVADENLNLVKNSMNGSFARSLERPQTVAQQALSIARFDLPKDFYESYLRKIEAVTKEDVMMAAKKYIRPDGANILIVGNKDDVAEKVKRFDSKGQVTFLNAEGEEVVASDKAMPEGLTAQDVIKSYIEAIGGESTLRDVSSVHMKYDMNVGAMTLSGTRKVNVPNQFLETVEMNGMVAQKQVYNNGKGMAQSPQGKQAVEGDELESFKMNAKFFGELYYDELGYELKLLGMGEVNGKDAYKVKVIPDVGEEKTFFFDVDSGLKLREISTAEGQQGPTTITLDYLDYEEVEGVKVPMTTELSGPMPQPIKMVVKEMKLNVDIDESEFKIEE